MHKQSSMRFWGLTAETLPVMSMLLYPIPTTGVALLTVAASAGAVASHEFM